MSHLLTVKYHDADEANSDEHTAFTMDRNPNDAFTEWAEALVEDGPIVWDNINHLSTRGDV